MHSTPSGNTVAPGLHQAIVEQAQDAIIFADRDGIIRLWNRGDLSFGLLKDEAGHVTGAFAIGRDCTARHLEQQAIRAQAASA